MTSGAKVGCLRRSGAQGPLLRDHQEWRYREPHDGRAVYGDPRRWWPEIDNREPVPDYCGVRPRLSDPGEPAAEFCVDGPEIHGVACLALADLVLERLEDRTSARGPKSTI